MMAPKMKHNSSNKSCTICGSRVHTSKKKLQCQLWKKTATGLDIRPVPQISTPAGPVDFRPISVTPVLSRIFERVIVWNSFCIRRCWIHQSNYLSRISLHSGLLDRARLPSLRSCILFQLCSWRIHMYCHYLDLARHSTRSDTRLSPKSYQYLMCLIVSTIGWSTFWISMSTARYSKGMYHQQWGWL